MKRYIHKRGRYRQVSTLFELPGDMEAWAAEKDPTLAELIAEAERNAEKAFALPRRERHSVTSVPPGGEFRDDEMRHFAIEVRHQARTVRRLLDSEKPDPVKLAHAALDLGYRWAQLVTNWNDRQEREAGRKKLSELRQARRDWLAGWLAKRAWPVESLLVSGRDAEAKRRRDLALEAFRKRFGSDASAAKFDRARGDLRDSI